MQDDQQNEQKLKEEEVKEEAGKEEKKEQQEGNPTENTEAEENTSTTTQQDEKDLKIEELKNALARAMADLQNFKRRSEEEKMAFIKYANIELLKSLLPFVDNLDRTVLHLPENLKEDQWAKGVIHVHSDLIKTLENLSIKKIPAVGEKLDPNKHEGLMSGPGEKDIILEEFEPGYMLGDTVIKVARVKVGDGS